MWSEGSSHPTRLPPLMFPCRFALSTRSIEELAARKAIRALEGRDVKDVREYVNQRSKKYHQMVEWIGKELGVTTLRYQKSKIWWKPSVFPEKNYVFTVGLEIIKPPERPRDKGLRIKE
jgi:hypothetical protein